MEYFLKIQDQSLQTMESIIDERHEKLVRNGDEVKEEIQAAFGNYIGWLRERESQLLREVDRAIQSHLWRSQSSLCETFSTLTHFKENVGLLESDKASSDIKNQIDKLLKDMTCAVQRDLKSSLVVKFDENGKNTLRTAIESCGEVYTETMDAPANKAVAISTSKWSNWLQSSNFEQMEEPDMLCDFGFLGGHKVLRTSAGATQVNLNLDSVEKPSDPWKNATNVASEDRRDSAVWKIDTSVPEINSAETCCHFEELMKSPMEQWLKPVSKRAESPKLTRSCPGKNAPCAHGDPDVEIENLGQLKCVSSIPNDLKTWLMQPDVVQLPPVAEICLGNQPCQKLSDCASAAHCIGYFFHLSRKSEDWLAPQKTLPMEPEVESASEISSSRFTTPSASVKSSRSDDFEVLSNASSFVNRDMLKSAISCVSDDLKLWLMSSSEPPADESEWLTINDDGKEKQKKFHASNRIDEWLMKC